MSTYINKLAKDLNLKIVDGRQAMAIEVQKADITRKGMKEPESCAFAKACARQIPGAVAAFFFKTSAWIQYEDRVERYILPPSAQKEIVSFDRSGIFAPGNYQLSPPRKGQSLKASRRRSKARSGRHQPANTGINRKFRHTTTMVRRSTVD